MEASATLKRSLPYHVLPLIDAKLQILPSVGSRDAKGCQHDVTVTVNLGSKIDSVVIKNLPTFHTGEIFMRIEIPIISAEWEFLTTDQSGKCFIIKLIQPVSPSVMDDDGKTYDDSSKEAEMIRVWCSIPWKQLDINTLLYFNCQISDAEFDQLKILLNQRSQSPISALSPATGPVSSEDLSQTHSNDHDGSQTEMWLDLRDSSSISSEVKYHERPEFRNFGKRIDCRSTRHENDNKQQSRQHGEPKYDQMMIKWQTSKAAIKEWSEFAKEERMRPEGTISCEQPTNQGYQHSQPKKSDYWESERQKTRWRRSKPPSSSIDVTSIAPEQQVFSSIGNQTSITNAPDQAPDDHDLKVLNQMVLQNAQPILEQQGAGKGAVFDQSHLDVSHDILTRSNAAEDPEQACVHPISNSQTYLGRKQPATIAIKKRRGGALFDSI